MSHPMWPACCGRLEKDCDCPYQHDIDDLLNLIKDLEKRVIDLERRLCNTAKLSSTLDQDNWYWEHG